MFRNRIHQLALGTVLPLALASTCALLTLPGCTPAQNVEASKGIAATNAASASEEAQEQKAAGASVPDVQRPADTEEATTMKIKVNDTEFTATLADNKAAAALAKRLEEAPLTIEMSDYSGFEKVGDLGFAPLANNKQINAVPGDIVLYAGNQIVVFYGSNSWSYTKLAHVDDLSGWKEALGSGDVTITLSL